MTRLEALLNAYLRVTELWAKCHGSESHSRMWKTAEFLEKLIRKEIERV